MSFDRGSTDLGVFSETCLNMSEEVYIEYFGGLAPDMARIGLRTHILSVVAACLQILIGHNRSGKPYFEHLDGLAHILPESASHTVFSVFWR